ncbi:MAG: scyllo-inositol 2-dehydrogenase (NADP(+)) IolW [Verrucomicrobiae bacterium]|nr:scyllo-inositol 2-dehydrogenase (NADP(+)) IolW [Verrucomicrobiae bacterium]
MKRFSNASDIKVGVVGYGGAFNMGKAHLNEMKRAGMTPVAVAEIDAARLAVAQTDFPGIETYATLTEMLKKSDVNLLAIITPHNTHAKLGLEALRAGRHVVCEKPMAITTAECDTMIKTAKQKGVIISTYHNRHWDGRAQQAVKDVVTNRCIGDIVRIEAHMGSRNKPGDWWRTSKSISGGILYDWGVHLLEYSLQLVRSEIVEVTGFAKYGFWGPQTKWKNDANEDEGFAVVRFKNGVVLTLCITQLDSNPKRGWVELVGTQGNYIIDGPENTHILRDGNRTTSTTSKHPDEGWKFYQNIADHLTKGERLVITGEWARRPIHILDLANQSAKKGATLKSRYK